MNRNSLAVLALGVLCLGPVAFGDDPLAGAKPRKVYKSEQEWARQLSRAQYFVCRQKGTEPAFSGKYVNNHAKGIYHCVACGAELFSSQAKFESGTGWPSFWKPVAASHIDTEMDYRASEPRLEVMCKDCGAHLGHVFSDGPPPTGLRFCINSVALKFVSGSSRTTPSKSSAAKEGKAAKAKETKPADSPSSKAESSE